MIFADLTHRYKTILQLVPKISELCLDIGGFSSGVYSRLSFDFNINVESINLLQDSSLNNIPTYVGDFFDFHIPKKFEYTFLIDVIEHIHDRNRIAIIEKAISAARKGLFLLFPYKCEENVDMEFRIRHLFSKYGFPLKNSLKEHFDYGLPETRMLFDYFDKIGISYSYRYTTKRDLFFDLFEKQMTMTSIRKRLDFSFVQSDRLSNVPLSNEYSDKYRIVFRITK